MKTTSFETMKGGTGKTMLSVNIAAMLAKEGRKVLFIDADPQANATEFFGIPMRMVDEGLTSANLFHIYEDEEDNPIYFTLEAPIRELPTLDLIPSHIALAERESDICSNLIEQGPGTEASLLRANLEKYKSFYNEYDNVIFDTNAFLGQINENIFNAVECTIMVTDPSYEGLMGILSICGLWDRTVKRGRIVDAKTPDQCILLNRFNKTKVCATVYDVLRGYNLSKEDEARFGSFASCFVDVPIPNSIKVAESSMKAAPIGTHNCMIPARVEVAIEKIVDELKDMEVL